MTSDFAAEGFLRQARGREFLVTGHGPENTSGLLSFRAVVGLDSSDELVALSAKLGLKLHASFDDAHTDLAMIETIGLLNHIEQLAKSLTALGYERITGAVIRTGDLPDLLTDAEMAAYLGRSVNSARRLRLFGGLPFLPGRPPLVRKQDFLNHLEQTRIMKRAKNPPPPPPYAQMTAGEQVAQARANALRMKLKPVRRPRPTGSP